MGTPANVNMGVCEVTFSGTNLGYTKGGVQVSYTVETMDVIVDQEDAPIDSYITGQNFTVTVPLAEENWDVLATVLPGTTLTTDGSKKKLVLSGAAGVSMSDMAAELVINPTNEDANGNVTVHNAIPTPNISVTFDKENVRVYTVVFKATVGASGFVTFGDTTASA